LVVLAGPNGYGKSSLFDLFLKAIDQTAGHGGYESIYHYKEQGSQTLHIAVTYHEGDVPALTRKPLYIRSAYRNDPDFAVSSIKRMQPMLIERRFGRLIDNDATVSTNYQRMYAQGMEEVYESEAEEITIKQFREKTIGEIRRSLQKVIPELKLESLGNPFKTQTFRFSKGTVQKYNYMNLSGGEKAAFDLLLDYVLKRKEYDDTVFCIDEPEAHLNPRVHGKMLEALVDLTEEKSQLWIATHSIGMLRRARDMYFDKPGQVIFLDFEKDFDQPQVLKPLVPDRLFGSARSQSPWTTWRSWSHRIRSSHARAARARPAKA
jgi:energy-coupling factor transporter ATP-binding protein EcfA2